MFRGCKLDLVRIVDPPDELAPLVRNGFKRLRCDALRGSDIRLADLKGFMTLLAGQSNPARIIYDQSMYDLNLMRHLESVVLTFLFANSQAAARDFGLHGCRELIYGFGIL